MNNDITKNNFDLIRLFAAFQVAIKHASIHLGYKHPIIDAISFLPGVPIFFFISGFCIYLSYEKSLTNKSPLKNFFMKRALRLYPALFFCFLFSVLLAQISGYFSTIEFSIKEFFIWTFTQLTFFQFFNPEFLRGFGEGSINGSLWTISTELQFYFLTPIIYFLFRKKLIFIIILISVFCLLNILNSNLNDSSTIILKLIRVSFLPWVFMFLLGGFMAKKNNLLKKILRINFYSLVIIFIILSFLSLKLGLTIDNKLNPIIYIVLVFLILKIAFYNPSLSDKLLKRNDISYGVYVFHMPIVNFLLYKEIFLKSISGFLLAILATILISIISWFLIEKPSMKFKRNQLRKHSISKVIV